MWIGQVRVLRMAEKLAVEESKTIFYEFPQSIPAFFIKNRIPKYSTRLGVLCFLRCVIE